MYKYFSLPFCYIILLTFVWSPDLKAGNDDSFRIARVKYSGGGDWYNDPSAEVNLLKFVKSNTNIQVDPEYTFVDINSSDIFLFPFLFLTGHGNIVLSENEAKQLNLYLSNGGFLYVDDDYGFDSAFRRELKKVFPDNDLVELPFSFGLYHCFYEFTSGPPKTHEHDFKQPRGFGIFVDKRLVLYYTVESNPSDGWADQEVHSDPQEKREEALKFGTNIIVWALSH